MTVIAEFECRIRWRIEILNYVREIICYDIQLIKTVVFLHGKIGLGLCAAEETPAAVLSVGRHYAVKMLQRPALNKDSVRYDAEPLSVVELFYLLGRYNELFQAVISYFAKRTVQDCGPTAITPPSL